MAQKEKEKKKIKPLAPAPTYTPIDASLNKTYIKPRGALKSNIVVSQEDLMPAQHQASQPLQVRGALSAAQPKAKPVENPFPNLPTVFDQVKAADTRFATPALPTSLPSPGEILKTDTTTFRPDPSKQIELTPYEQWYNENIGNSGIGKALTGLQNVGRGISEFGKGAVDTATFGLSRVADEAALRALDDETIRGMYDVDKMSGATKAGEFAGYIAPGAAIERGVAAAARPVIKNLGALARTGITGAAAGALDALGQETGDVAFRGRTFDPANIALGAGIGGGGGALLAGLGKGMSAIYNRLKSNNVPEEVIQEILALPAPRQRGNINTVVTPNVMPGFGGGRLPELPAPGPLGLPEPRFAKPTAQQAALPLPRNMDRIQRAQGTVLPQGEGTIFSPASSAPTSARIGQRVNPYRQQFEALMQRAREIQEQGGFTPGREMEELESLWSQMAGRDAVGIDELIQRAYVAQPNRVTPDLVQRARSTQSEREVAGAPLPVRTQADRFPELQRTEGPVPSTPRESAEYTPDQLASSRQVQQEFVQNMTRKKRLNTPIVGRVDAPVERVGRAPQIEVLPPQTKTARPRQEINSNAEQTIKQARQKADVTPQDTPLTRPMVDDATIVSGTTRGKSLGVTDEFGFAQTVRTSGQTDPELARILNDKKLTGSRTTDEANLQAAQNLIDRNGAEKVADRIINKRGALNTIENTAAQVLSRYYSETGQLEKAIQIISKTAKSGRELGQAVQALSRWNKLDQEGAILLAERQLNRRTKDTDAWKTLTPEQAAPVQTSAQGIEKVQDVQNIAREVVDMLANRKSGQPFSDAEKALLQNFNNTITEFDKTVRPILQAEKDTRNKTIKEIGAIEPKKRTRDQVVSYLDAQADKAMEALKRQRNVGIISDQTNPVILYAVIGASKLAKGAVKFADWSELMIRSGITDRLAETYVKSVNKFRKENGLPTNSELNRVINTSIKDKVMTEEMANSLRAMAAEIGFYADDVKIELTQDLQRAMQRIGTSTLGEKISTLQTASMLLNIPTFLRNAIGNSTMILAEKANKIAAVPIDWTVSKLTGERTIRFNPDNQEKFWKNFAEGTVKEGWEGVSTTGTLDAYDLQPNVFGDNNPLKYITKTLGASLQGFDTAAYRRAYGDVVATYATNIGKAQGLSNAQIRAQMPELIKQLDDRIIEMADEAGRYATFQDDTILSKGAVSVKRGLNAITDVPARKLREKGILPESISTEGFGLGDVVLKFAKTPANLVMRGIDYSPLGFVRSLIEIAPAILKKQFNQREFVLSLSRAITGTLGFTGLGFVLAKNGILTGAASQDKDLRSLQEQAGQGAYKVNLSALGRWITSGLDPDEAEALEGDRMLDYAWMQPIAISLGMGVNAAEAMDKPLKPGEEQNNFKLASTAILGGLGTILENPLVTGVQNLTDAADTMIKRQDFSGFARMIQGIPASFIPTVVGQVRTGMDNAQRETFDKRLFGAVWNQMKNKLPLVSDSLPVSYGSLGQERERIQGGESGSMYNYLTSLLSPFKYTQFKVTPEAKIALDIFKESKDPSTLPRIGLRSIKVKDPVTKLNKTVDLTNEQFSMLQQKMGQEVSAALLKRSSFFESPAISVSRKVKQVGNILNDAGSKARNELRVDMGYKKQ